MAIKKVELKHECFPKYLRMETARRKKDKEKKEEDKQKRVEIEEVKWARNKEVSRPSCSSGRPYNMDVTLRNGG